MDNRFQNAKIYKIVDVGYNKCYIGSTCEELSRRMAHHREGFKIFLRDGKNIQEIMIYLMNMGLRTAK